MANRVRLKRRVSGNAGAPATLLNGEVAYNEVSDQLWYGKGLGQDGNATSVICIGGEGTYATKSYVASAVSAVDVSSQLANYLTTSNAASTYLSISSASSTYLSQSSASSTYLSQSSASSTYLTQANASTTYATQSSLATYLLSATAASTYLSQSSAAATYAPINNPTFLGVVAAPTPTGGDNSTKVATTAFVSAAIAALVNSAPGTLDTLGEIAQALSNDPNLATTLTTSIATKLTKSSNLSDLTDAATARSNLGLGSMATQSASNVNITGGSIDNIVLDSGTF